MSGLPISRRIPRQLAAVLSARARQYPVVTVTGPRQAGKTTLCRDVFPNLPYANLEQPDVREFAFADPGGFLARYPRGAIIDEVQRVPSLLSWIQVRVDATPGYGQFILTGSHQFDLMASVTQSLAGRTALLKLLPLSVNELCQAGLGGTTDHLLFAGGYPRIHAQGLSPAVVLGDYFETYVERDLRQLIELRQLREFRRFVQLCAGRVGCLLNLASLANDVGISGHTARAWLSLLEASYVVYLLPPWFENIGKRLIKSPKLYFYDVGLAAWLAGVRDASQLVAHPLRGFLFENLVVMEFVKQFEHHGQRVPLCFYRDSQGVEVDLVVQDTGVPGGLGLVEIKSAQTYHGGFAAGLKQASALLGSRVQRKMVVYGGDQDYVREGIEVVGLQSGSTRP
jgi:predicted AAA+ superfamily ATPase